MEDLNIFNCNHCNRTVTASNKIDIDPKCPCPALIASQNTVSYGVPDVIILISKIQHHILIMTNMTERSFSGE